MFNVIRALLAVANSSPGVNEVSTNDTHSFLWVIFPSGFIFDFLPVFYRMIKKKNVSTKPLRDFLSFLESSVNVTLVPPPTSGVRSTRVALTSVLPDLLHLTVLVPSLPPRFVKRMAPQSQFSLTGRFPRWTFFHMESNRWRKRYRLLKRASEDDRSHQFTSDYFYVCLPWEILIIAGTLMMKSALPLPHHHMVGFGVLTL